MSFGSAAWDRLFGDPRPAELHPFREIVGGSRHAVSTPGDVLFHLRAERTDLCFELATQIMAALGDAVSVEDEVHAFRYFDNRDLLGLRRRHREPGRQRSARRGTGARRRSGLRRRQLRYRSEVSARFAGMERAETELQERIIGRTKVADIELDDAVKPTSAHNALNTIVEDGVEKKIFRANGIFGRPGQSEFGTYFIGYARSPRHDRADAAEHVRRTAAGQLRSDTGFQPCRHRSLFFAPPASFLDSVTPAGQRPCVRPLLRAALRQMPSVRATARSASAH